MFKYAAVTLIIVMGLSLSGLSCSLFSQSPSNTNNTQPTSSSVGNSTASGNLLTTISPDQINSQAASNYAKSNQEATSWQPDAVLYALNIKLSSSLKVNQATEIYIYGSSADPKVWYTVSVNQQTGKVTRAWVMKQDYMPEIQNQVKIQYWKTNYVEALQQAEKNGGKVFRDKNPNANISLTLSITQPKNWLWWTVEYQASFSGETLKIKVDTNTGKIYSESGEPTDKASTNQ
ncbi:MAG: hypothetical protein COX39_03375 [Candidatus Nealsonbacteria bacterium CG23_combo_of_CG06-09_8_20_14_all_40_13]|uniref:PepSY domain-containing protein n=1 Tax=Candidatus Nealsonbacteria bacterium CG23_combo_of_CG06-09_8_20_14_all_40_13 TaxID=1974724 RepID=A0A2G9YRQ1_9BACT|nr:MAG: hypothetical protein COX39_03375 [Candidatus Nealsonbacteria bacterium CG23_combo_of_CG06-09_8_20_14_all_40_13]PIR71050.1 MAG: hypothetical protein COU44_01685 [Candidatus Nealsonbacteria bacterium CG10_big_fil_rev_8_21_14_0_10_40_24]